jgi:hypothetical protein
MILGGGPVLLSVLQMGWVATQRYSRSTFHSVCWEMAVFPLWRKLLALGTRRYRNSYLVIMTLQLWALSHHITDLDLQCNQRIGDDGASLLARSLGSNALPKLTHLSLFRCGIDDDGFIALVSALEQNTSLLHLDLRDNYKLSERAFLALADSLPNIKVLQRVDLRWCTDLASAMPLLLAGLHMNTSLFRIHVANCAPSSVPPTDEETIRCAGGWIQEMERLGYRNRFLPVILAPKEMPPPLGAWPHALARVATLPDVIYELLFSESSLVLSAGTEGTEEAKGFKLKYCSCQNSLSSGIPRNRMHDYQSLSLFGYSRLDSISRNCFAVAANKCTICRLRLLQYSRYGFLP